MEKGSFSGTHCGYYLRVCAIITIFRPTCSAVVAVVLSSVGSVPINELVYCQCAPASLEASIEPSHCDRRPCRHHTHTHTHRLTLNNANAENCATAPHFFSPSVFALGTLATTITTTIFLPGPRGQTRASWQHSFFGAVCKPLSKERANE